MIQEHRISPRKRTLKSGRISFADETRSIECQIRNLSLTGASLVVPMTVIFPRAFDLTDLHGGERHAVEIVWRKGDRMGVRFVDVAEITPPTPLPRAEPRLRARRLLHSSAPVSVH